MRSRARRRKRSCAELRLPFRLLLPRLPSVCALPRTTGRARYSRRNRYLPYASEPREDYNGHGRGALPAFLQQGLRWYTDCCRTPIGNTAGPRFPVIEPIHSFMSLDADGRTRDEMLGVPLCRITRAPRSGRSRRTRLRRAHSASLPSAYQRFSAGGCAGSVGLTRSSTIIRTLHSPCRAYLRRVSALLLPMILCTVIRGFDRYLPCNDLVPLNGMRCRS